ncbi:MAG: DUF4157 domain-containing protein, partial [Planctomycetota bacterium]
MNRERLDKKSPRKNKPEELQATHASTPSARHAFLREQQMLGNQRLQGILLDKTEEGPPGKTGKDPVTVNPAGGTLEREADRLSRGGQKAQRSSAPRPGTPERHAKDGHGAGDRLARMGDGKGKPLPAGEQERWARRLGHDFSGVRMHTGEAARSITDLLGTKGFTTGEHVFL